MIRPNGIDFLNFVAKSSSFVRDKLNEIVWGGFAGEEFEETVDCFGP